MPLRLYPPGTRKGNKSYYAIGSILGKQYEINTGKSNARDAERFARDAEKHIRTIAERERSEAAKNIKPQQTFRMAAEDYILAKGIDGGNEKYYIEGLIRELGHLVIGEVTGADVGRAARALYPTHANATLNRQAYTPAAAILHWAAENRIRDYIVIKKLCEEKPRSRRPATGTVEKLVREAEGIERLFLLVLWAQGWRVSEPLPLTWEENIRLADQEFDLRVGKARRWKMVQMHPDVFEALAAIPETERTGRLFPWTDRFGVYRWLRPLCKRLGVTFTPHMARHAFASDLNAAGATDADLMNAGSWTSMRAIARYTEVDRNHARATLAKRGTLGETLGEHGKARK